MEMINKYKKKIIYIILFFIIICIKTNVLAAIVDVRDDPEMDTIIQEIQNWDGYGRTTEGELAGKIEEICGGDIKKIEKLQNTYTYNGMEVWNGQDPDSMHYKATNIAISSNKNNSQIQDGNQKEKDKLLGELSEMSYIVYNDGATIEELKELDKKLDEYNKKYGLTEDILKDMAQKVKEKLAAQGEEGKTTIDDVNEREEDRDEYISTYVPPTSGVLGALNDGSASHTPDEIINGAIDFKNSGDTTIPISGDNIQKGSSTLFNILLSIAFFLAVAIGMYLGVKIMLSNAEDKAKTKEALIPYIAGCVVIFGAFAIWKLAITLLSGIEKVSDLPIRNEYVIARELDEK